ncbi:uncharacterized protein LOC124925279 [Impatiens glandulifera]|uniref:uncharacterized protein LOC124925279 n=1 Tax=Impatiens glandulifera TaxID=253017 RepID=UPI001FB0C083|nr:uncharacterized protein LOC124925279 [Impatiens glandulifera]
MKSCLNSIFMSTLNTAARSLVSVASGTRAHGGKRWGVTDHFRYVMMMSTWMAVWAIRVVMDYFPISLVPNQPVLLLQGVSSNSFDLPPLPALDMALNGSEVFSHNEFDPSAQGIGKALIHMMALINEIPVASRKYQMAVSMADKIVEDNSRSSDNQILLVNRIALSSAFSRTSGLLLRTLRSSADAAAAAKDDGWTHRIIRSLPLGNYLSKSLKGVGFWASLILPNLPGGGILLKPEKKRQPQPLLALTSEERENCEDDGGGEDVVAEKYVQELMWIANKMRISDDVDDAVVQWSLAPGLASLSLIANPRVQAFLVKISGLLFGEVAGGTYVLSREVKLRLLMLWLPLLIYGGNGLSYPVLSGYEKMELERSLDEVISTLPEPDQELVLVNWLQDFITSSSDWPNLQNAYDRWCRLSRKLSLISDTNEDC